MLKTQEDVQNWKKNLWKKLSAPFHPSLLSWRVLNPSNKDSKNSPQEKIVAPYVDARDVRHRLNESIGLDNWSTTFENADNGGITCNLYLRLPYWEDGVTWKWVGKADGASETNIEAIKGAHSVALRRAAANWGIGQYLYDLPEYTVDAVRTWRGYDFDTPELPEFAIPSVYTDGEINRVNNKGQKGISSLRERLGEENITEAGTVMLPVEKEFTKEEILSTALTAAINPAFGDKTIADAIHMADELYVISWLAGYKLTDKSGEFVPKTDEQKLVQKKARVYYQYYMN